MSGYAGEPERQRRAVYLHEAGHVVAARHYQEAIVSVQCDGNSGFVDRQSSSSQIAKVATFKSSAGSMPPNSALAAGLQAYEGMLVCFMSGIAGETLEVGRALSSVSRSCDDLASITMILGSLLGSVSPPDRHAHLTAALRSIADKAHSLIHKQKASVFAIADALQTKGRLKTDEIEAIVCTLWKA